MRRFVMGTLGCGAVSSLLVLTASGRAQDKPIAKPPEKPAAGSGKSIISNGDFEKGDKAPAGWQPGNAVDGVEIVWDQGTGYNSQKSLRLKKTAQKFFPIADWFQAVPHSGATNKVKVTAWVKAEKAAKATVDVQFTSKDGEGTHKWAAYIGAKEAGDPPADHDWKQYSGVVEIPAGTKEIRIALQIYGPGTVWFDDVSAEYVPNDTPVTDATKSK